MLKLISSVRVLADGAFWNSALLNRITALVKEAPEISLAPFST